MTLWQQYKYVEAYLKALQDKQSWQYEYLLDWLKWCQYMWE